LGKQLADLKNELLTLRVQKIAGGSASKLTKMYVAEGPVDQQWVNL
jgi:large subunit ribosomal protein L35e